MEKIKFLIPGGCLSFAGSVSLDTNGILSPSEAAEYFDIALEANRWLIAEECDADPIFLYQSAFETFRANRKLDAGQAESLLLRFKKPGLVATLETYSVDYAKMAHVYGVGVVSFLVGKDLVSPPTSLSLSFHSPNDARRFVERIPSNSEGHFISNLAFARQLDTLLCSRYWNVKALCPSHVSVQALARFISDRNRGNGTGISGDANTKSRLLRLIGVGEPVDFGSRAEPEIEL